jgi:hypothetical protein
MTDDPLGNIAKVIKRPRRSHKPAAPWSIDELVPKAEKAVKMLEVHEFIARNVDKIREKLEAYDDLTSSRGRGDVTFATLSLPIASGVIHVASDPDALDDASQWARQEGLVPPQDDTLSTLAVLVLLYTIDHGRKGKWLASKGGKAGSSSAEKEKAERETWQGFWSRIENALKDI